MSDQSGKTPEQILEDMRVHAQAAMSGNPLPPLEETEAPEQSAEKPSVEETQAEAKADAGEPSKFEPSSAPEESKLPEKYQGKTPEELVKMLDEQHSYIGKLGSESSHARDEVNKMRAELDEIKTSVTQKKTQDQETSLKEGLDGEDPAQTLIDYVERKFESVEKKSEQELLNRQEQEANAYYSAQLENPDFSRRREHVDKVAGALAPYVKPEYVKSKDFVEICDLISKGTDIDHYIQQAKSEAASQKEAGLQEKREAQTVSGSSSGTSGGAENSASTEEERRAAAVAAFAKLGR